MIFDDSAFHQGMAQRQLSEHTLTIFVNYEEALHALSFWGYEFPLLTRSCVAI